MEPTPPVTSSGPRGYLSEEARRSFTLAAGLLGVVFFVVQILVPMVAVLVWLPLTAGAGGFRTADLEGAVCAGGAVWYVEETEPFGDAGKRQQKRLLRIDPAGAGEAEKVADLDMESPRLLADGPSVWIISPEAMALVTGGQVLPRSGDSRLGNISQPFLLDGHPALLEQRPGRLGLLALRQDWTLIREFSSTSEEEDTAWMEKGQFLSLGPEVHLFRKSGGTLFHREGITGQQAGAWEAVASGKNAWKAVGIGGEPAVLLVSQDGLQFGLRGLKKTAGRWEEFLRVPLDSVVSSMGGCAVDAQGRELALLFQSLPGSIRLLRVRDGSLVSERSLGSLSFPFTMLTGLMPTLYLLPAAGSILLALILSALMRKYRPGDYSAGGRRVQMASLARRAMAELVDALILAGPALWGYALFFRSFASARGFSLRSFFMGFGFILAGILWALVGTVVFSYLEGRWGRTPGKWLFGILVLGTDLQPCGFVRGLVRNLLRVVDGFFNFLVGILVTALSENWQRVGDMAARTVVIRDERPRPPNSAPP